MNSILFPSQYKKAILNKTKNTTIRIGTEIGKYKAGKIYLVKSYAENSWKIEIKVDKIIKTTFGRMQNFGIPKRSIESIRRKGKLSSNSPVEIIRFSYKK